VYYKTIDELKTVAEISSSKSRHQYYILNKFEVLTCGDVEKLIKKRKSSEDSPIYYATIEDTYDIISKAHVATGHGGRDRMLKHLAKKYANITTEAVELFKSYCLVCQEKRKRPKTTGVVVRPILSKEFNSRCQVDLIDMQSSPQGQFKWIMVYQCHLTKFIILRPLTSKRAGEVAFQLLDIFLLFGAPVILQSDNGTEFTAQVITELKQLWPQLVMVHGKPRHPQSQGSVERANSDIKDILVAWMSDNNTQDWSIGLKFVQQQKNGAHHAGINRTPFKAMFGEDPKVGLTSSSLSSDMLARLQSEDDLVALLSANPASDNNSATPAAAIIQSSILAITERPTSEPSPPATSEPSATASSQSSSTTNKPSCSANIEPSQPAVCESSPLTVSEPMLLATRDQLNVTVQQSSSLTPLDKRLEDITNERKRAGDSQLSQAERMIKRSRIDLKPGVIGDNVAVPIPMVDRGRGDPRNIIGVIVDRDEHDMYRIAVKAGILSTKYSRNQFDLCPQRLLADSDVNTQSTITLRQALKSSASGGQGFFHCDCSKSNKQCQTNRCKCFKSKKLCNSRCHDSLTCQNKN
jgi:hypothetical protein